MQDNVEILLSAQESKVEEHPIVPVQGQSLTLAPPKLSPEILDDTNSNNDAKNGPRKSRKHPYK